jgi:hypothetical protein
MADATDTLVDISMASVAIGVMGAIFLIWTLNAAREANRIAAETAESQLRAYVVLDDIDHEEIPHPAGRDPDLRVFVRWKNAGGTPARSVRWDINRTILAGNLPSNFGFPPLDIGTKAATIGPGQVTKDVSLLIDAIDVGNAHYRGESLYVWGWVEYSDVFIGTPRRRSEFCVEVSLQSKDGGGLDYRNHTETEHNGNDDDCLKRPMTTA